MSAVQPRDRALPPPSRGPADALGADVPSEWPPALFGGSVMRAVQAQLLNPAERGWSVWYLLDAEPARPANSSAAVPPAMAATKKILPNAPQPTQDAAPATSARLPYLIGRTDRIVKRRLGWDMTEGIFGEWLKQDGDAIKPGDLLYTVEVECLPKDIPEETLLDFSHLLLEYLGLMHQAVEHVRALGI